MTPNPARRIRADEWQAARDLRLEALRDPIAHLAFLTRLDDALGRSDDDWREGTVAAATGTSVAQFVTTSDGGHILGTATALCPAFGEVKFPGDVSSGQRANIVAVFIRPAHRGTGVLRRLLDTTEAWLRQAGTAQARLHVHEKNHRAQSAYLKCGYIDTGVRLQVDGGWEQEMVRDLRTPESRA